MERLLKELVERLQKAHGERLVSVVLYGSAAAGDYHAHHSDLNILCVLDRITPRELGDSEPVFRWWRDKENPAPLLLSEDEVRTSADCFPIEFYDIQHQSKLLAGRDVVSAVNVDFRFHRAQVEHELRAKLLRLRQKAAGILSDKALLLRLLTDSLSTFLVLARHSLLLGGEAPPAPKREIVARCSERLGIDAGPFYTLLDLREEKKKPREVDAGTLFASYLEQIAVLVNAVDRLEN